MFIEVINGIDSNSIYPIPQSRLNIPTVRCYPRRSEDSLISWDMDVFYIERLINASADQFNGDFTFFKGNKIIIWKAYAKELVECLIYVSGQVLNIDKNTETVTIGGLNGVLVVEEVSVSSDTARIYHTSIIRSYRDRFTDKQ